MKEQHLIRFDRKAIAYWERLREIPNPTDRYRDTARVLSLVPVKPKPC